VESADPRVFAKIQKGESLAQIEKAIHLVQQAGIPLYLCMVLGLPESSAEADRRSSEFIKRVRPTWVYWNMCTA